ncbi:MAG: ATP-dependent zinc protease [Phycisphaerae bacterium]
MLLSIMFSSFGEQRLIIELIEMSNGMSDSSEGCLPVIIGAREFIDFPTWGISGIEAKTDTGARTSAIHVEGVKNIGNGRVEFKVVRRLRDPESHVLVTSEIVRLTSIRSSTGHAQERIIVAEEIMIGSERRRIEMSLVRRAKMRCRMLLGRTALHGMLVNPDQSFLLSVDQRRKRTSRQSDRGTR